MRKHSSLAVLVLSIAVCLIAGCSSGPSGPGMGTMSVRMTDAPGDFQSVSLVVTQVSAHLGGADEFADAGDDSADTTSGGWVVLNNTPATYDLLTLENGVFATIGLAKVPAGHYTQVRLKLGPGSTVTVDGVQHPLTVPSGLQSGLKLVGSFDVPANGLLDIALDFDAAHSIVLNGAGEYHLKPTVKVLPFSTAGAIAGLVSPAGTPTTIYAIQAPDTVGSTTAADDGHFTISVLAPGTYSVGFHPAAGFRDTSLAGIAVTAHTTTDVGTVVLTAQ
jgi:hypothetical protein